MGLFLIEPCCSQKHLRQLCKTLGEDGTVFFHGYGDLSLNELLQPLLSNYSETELMIVVPYLPDMAANEIAKWMRKQWARMDGSGNIDVIAHMTLVADLSEKRSPKASSWVKDNPFGERLKLKDIQQNDTAIILPDLALWGPINIQYGRHFTAMATKNTTTIESLRAQYVALTKG